MKNGLGVFDFKEEEELAEFAAAKILDKLKNPSIDNPAFLNCDLLECSTDVSSVAKESDVHKKETEFITCVVTDAIDCDTTCAPLEMAGADFCSREDNSILDAALQSESPIHTKDSSPKMDKNESKNSFQEQDARTSCHETLSPVKGQSNGAFADSPSNGGLVSLKSEGDISMSESSPSTPASSIADDGAIEGHLSENYFSASEMDVVNIGVDYVLYRDNYITGCLATVSSDGIKISRMPAYENDGNFSFERAIDDILRIESQQLERFGAVIVKFDILSKDAAQAGNSYGVEQLELTVGELNWSGKLEEIVSLNVKYLALSTIVRDTDVTIDGVDLLRQRSYFPVFDEAVEDVVYPQGDSDAVSISKRDFDLLQPETFINDTIIDFYIKYLKNQIPPEEKLRFHFFNSFFFRKLADLDKDPSSASDGRAAFLRVRKWTRKVDIFAKDYIFIPVNFNLHWSLLIICHPGEVASFNDKDLGKSPRVPCVLHMDSIKGTHAGLKNLVQSYLWEEWKSRQKETSEDLSSKFLNLRFVPLELPQQENLYDCGLFLLHYLELFLAEAPLNFSPFRINKLSKFLTVDWFPPVEASLKRTLIQRLISGLLDDHPREHSSDDCSDEPGSSFPENNEKANQAEFVSERCTSSVACHGNLSNSDAGIEITLLEASSMRNSECVNDPGLVLREFFEPGAATGSLLAHCSSFDQSSYYQLNGAISQQIEDDTENGEQFMYYPSGESIFQQMPCMTPQACSVPQSLRSYRADPSWNPGISMEKKNGSSSPETSECASDDSDIGIIENCPIKKDVDLFQKQKIDQESQSTENVTCMPQTLVLGSIELPESSAVEVTEDSERKQNEQKIDQESLSMENIKCSPQPLVTCSIELPESSAVKVTEDSESIQNEEKVDQESQSMENIKCSPHSLVSCSTEMLDSSAVKVTEDSERIQNGDGGVDLALKQEYSTSSLHGDANTLENGMHQHFDKDAGLSGSDNMEITVGNGMARSNGNETIIDGSEEEHAAKRRRLTPLEEGNENPSGSLSEDLHL